MKKNVFFFWFVEDLCLNWLYLCIVHLKWTSQMHRRIHFDQFLHIALVNIYSLYMVYTRKPWLHEHHSNVTGNKSVELKTLLISLISWVHFGKEHLGTGATTGAQTAAQPNPTLCKEVSRTIQRRRPPSEACCATTRPRVWQSNGMEAKPGSAMKVKVNPPSPWVTTAIDN